MTREIMHKIQKTEGSISDSELDSAIKFLDNLQDMLFVMGDEYNLARKDVTNILVTLENYKFARNRKFK